MENNYCSLADNISEQTFGSVKSFDFQENNLKAVAVLGMLLGLIDIILILSVL